MTTESKSPVQTLKDNWFIIIFFMGMAVTWGSFSQKDRVQEARIEILEAKVEKIDDGLAGVNEKLVEISTSLGYIQKAVDELAAE